MKLLKSITTTSLVTMLSRILGFIRDFIIAKTFGADIATDAFLIAFKLPNLLRRIFAEGAFSQVFVPILAEYKRKQGIDAARMFISYVSGLLTLSLTIVSIFGILAAPWIVIITAPGMTNTADKFILTTKLLRITFPYILLISLSSLVGAILNTWNKFAVPALAPIFLNISIIFFALFASPYFHPPVLALAWAIIVGGFFQLTYQLPFLKKISMLVLPRINLYDIGILRVVKQMGTAVLGTSASQISLIINTIIASFFVPGSISWMYYADRLIEFPLGVLGAALGTVLLPFLSKSFVISDHNKYCYLINYGLRLCFLLAFPSTVAIIILANPLIISLFQYGEFTAFDVLMTKHTLIACSIGLIGLIAVKILTLGFYSRQDIKTPIKITIITLIITQLMNLIFIDWLKHVGLSLSVGISAYLNAIFLYWELRKRHIFIPQPGWIKFLLHISIGVLAMSIVLIGILYVIPDWSFGTMIYRLLRLTAVILAGIITYFLTLIALGLKLTMLIKCTM